MARITILNEAKKPLHRVQVMTVTCHTIRQVRHTDSVGSAKFDDVLGRTEIFLRDHEGIPWKLVGNPLRSLKGNPEVIY